MAEPPRVTIAMPEEASNGGARSEPPEARRTKTASLEMRTIAEKAQAEAGEAGRQQGRSEPALVVAAVPGGKVLGRGESADSVPMGASGWQQVWGRLVPKHVRRRAATYQWPTCREALVKAACVIEWPYFPWAYMDWKQYPKIAFDDLLAGVVVGVILIPQGMSYALLGNLPPIMGLYAATIAGYVYTLLGSSGQLTIGPVALVSTFMTDTFSSLGVSMDKKDSYAAFVRQHVCAVLSLAVGIMLIVMGAFRLGRLMKFVSPSVMVGFTTGAGVYIGLSQVKYMFGVKVKEEEYYYATYRNLIHEARHNAHPTVMKIGWSAWAVLFFFFLLKKVVKGTPKRRKQLWYKLFLAGTSSTTLILLIIMTVITKRLREGGHDDIPIIGDIPAGFNPFVAPKINHFGLDFGTVMYKAIPLMLLCYMESMAVARKYAVVNRYQIDNNQEMWALGMGCIVASFFTAYPPGGSFSRTALKAELGVKTPFANVYASLLVTIVLCRFTALLKFVPMAFLGAVIDVAVLGLMDFHEMYKALWVAPIDFVVMVFTFVLTAFFNTELGLEFGILASIVVLVWQISSLDVAAIGQLRHSADGGVVFADVNRYPEATLHTKVRVLRLTANLFFGNAGAFRDEFYSHISDADNDIKVVIVDAQGVSNLDLSTLAVFHELLDHCNRNSIQLRFSNVSSKLVFYLEGYDLVKPLGGVEQVQRSLEDVHAEVIRVLGEESARKKMTQQHMGDEEEGFEGPKPARSLTM